jgi:hypothetical protein
MAEGWKIRCLEVDVEKALSSLVLFVWLLSSVIFGSLSFLWIKIGTLKGHKKEVFSLM